MSKNIETLVKLQTELDGNDIDAARATAAGMEAEDGRTVDQAYVCMARWFLRRGRRIAAEDSLAAARRHAADEGVACLWALQLHLENGDPAMVRLVSDEAGRRRPDSLATALGRLAGLLATADATVDEALGAVLRLRQADGLAPVLRTLAAVGSGEAADGDAGVGAFPDGLPDGEDEAALSWRFLADAAANVGAKAVAREALRRAVQAMPVRLDWQYALAARLIRDGVPHALAPFWQDLPVRFPGAPRWLMISCRAWSLSGHHNDRALADARAALALKGDFWPARMAEAHLLTEQANAATIAEHFAACREGRRSRGGTLPPLSAAGFEQTVAAAVQAVELCPSAMTWNDLGTVYAFAGRLSEAAAAYRQALSIDPAQRHATINYAIVLLCLGEEKALARHLRTTRFLAELPKSLQLRVPQPPADPHAVESWSSLWRSPADCHEWRRGTVFSQHWWRVLPDLLTT